MNGEKHDDNKNDYSLLPFDALEQVSKVLTFGAKKYKRDNWKTVPNSRTRYFSASCRHLFSWFRGEVNDPETGFNHLAHAICCLMFLLSNDLEIRPNDLGKKNEH